MQRVSSGIIYDLYMTEFRKVKDAAQRSLFPSYCLIHSFTPGVFSFWTMSVFSFVSLQVTACEDTVCLSLDLSGRFLVKNLLLHWDEMTEGTEISSRWSSLSPLTKPILCALETPNKKTFMYVSPPPEWILKQNSSNAASREIQRYKGAAAPANSLTPFWSKAATFESA